MCEGNCLHCPVMQRGHVCTEQNAAEQLAKSMRAAERDRVMAQIAEDTCEKHGLFACELCFDMEVSVDPVFMDRVMIDRLRKALQA